MKNNTGEIIANIIEIMFSTFSFYILAYLVTGDMKTAVLSGLIGIVLAKADSNKTDLENKIFELEQKLNQKK